MAILRFVILINTVRHSGWGEGMCCVVLREENSYGRRESLNDEGGKGPD